MFSLLFSFCVIIAFVNSDLSSKDYFKREHSLVKPFQGSGMGLANYDFLGSTMLTNNYIRLTPDLQSKQGTLWNSVPIKSRHWEIQIQFKVHGKGKTLFGDGLVIWYTKDRMQMGPVFGSKDYFSGLAVILDTYSNHNGPHNHGHPYISAMVNNGSLHYDHDKDGTHTEIAGCEAKFRNLPHDTYLAIRYENDILTVSHDIRNRLSWQECFRVGGVKLPTNYFLGVSATTGDLSDNHDIMSIKFFELEVIGASSESRHDILPSAEFYEPPRERVEDEESQPSALWTLFLIVMGVVAVLALVALGLYVYSQNQEQNRKRFY